MSKIITEEILRLIQSDTLDDNRLALRILHKKCSNGNYTQLRDEMDNLWYDGSLKWEVIYTLANVEITKYGNYMPGRKQWILTRLKEDIHDK